MNAFRRGFTLVEMIVVMMVMIILMGLMMPAMLRMMDAHSVEATGRELSAALAKARGLACGSGDHYGVVFNNVSDDALTTQSYENVNHWYVVVCVPCGTGVGECGNLTATCEGHDCGVEDCWKWADGDLENKIEDKLMELREGSVFSSLSSVATTGTGIGKRWNEYDKDKARWAWTGVSNAQDADATDDADATNDVAEAVGIHFNKTGSAFYENTDGTIGIGKDGADMPILRVYVESLTGLGSVTRRDD